MCCVMNILYMQLGKVAPCGKSQISNLYEIYNSEHVLLDYNDNCEYL